MKLPARAMILSSTSVTPCACSTTRPKWSLRSLRMTSNHTYVHAWPM
jgi:hypothetical protein